MNRTTRNRLLRSSLLAALLGIGGTLAGQVGAKPSPYILSGVVRSDNGQPVAGAEISASNTLYYNANILGTTDKQGRYSIRLPKGELGTWTPYATLRREYRGETYKVTLVANDATAFTAQAGAVRDFTWKLTGKKPSGGYYGGALWIYRDVDAESFDLSRVEVTLVPDGPLIDGSKGKTVKAFWGDDRLSDLPIGRYKVTARYVPQSGAPRTVLLSGSRATTYVSAMTSDFQPARHTSGYLLEFTVRLGEAQAATGPSEKSVGSRSISGTLSAEADLKGTVVVACIEQGGDCIESTQREVTVTTSGREARYVIDGLQAGSAYSVFAWKDVNGDTQVNRGDLVGLYGASTGGQSVVVPASSAHFNVAAMK